MTLQRRDFISGLLAAGTLLPWAMARAQQAADDPFHLQRDWSRRPNRVMPDPAWEIHDPDFAGHLGNAFVERLWTGGRWTEGPVWMPDWRCLLFSDIPRGRVMRWNADNGQVSIYESQSFHANGHTRDRQGRLISCEHGSRSLSRIEHDGSRRVLADGYRGKPLNAPNDVVVGRDGCIWFTDPGYGILSFYEGTPAPFELPTAVYRLDPESGRLDLITTLLERPNGIALSPDDRRLYVSDTGFRGEGRTSRLWVFGIDAAGQVDQGRALVEEDGGVIDGLRCDSEGRLWCSWAGSRQVNGVRVFSPEGQALATLHLPETVSNLAFGGEKGNRLFITGGESLYATFVNAVGDRI